MHNAIYGLLSGSSSTYDLQDYICILLASYYQKGQAEKNSGDSSQATQDTTCCCSFQVCETKVKDYIYPAFLPERKQLWL